MPRVLRTPCSSVPRRLQLVIALTVAVLICIALLGSSGSSRLPSTAQNVLLGPPAHPPAHRNSSTTGQTRWFADWKWRNPFSSDTTLDEELILLPPLPDRPPVYTYFDPESRRKDEKSKQAEQDLLHIWRRAWWAKGFRPVVLSSAEAMDNPLYRNMQGLELNSNVRMELMRWLAWSNMGNGFLCNWLAVPMAPFDDALLAFLRRGEYPALSRYEAIGDGLFVGSKTEVETAIKEALDSPSIEHVDALEAALPPGTIETDAHGEGVAFYSLQTIHARYPVISEKLDNATTRSDGLAMLPPLINSHLHLTWQNTFSDGIAVLKPLPGHTSALVQPAVDMAVNLSQCSYSPIPTSCPPNQPRCRPCVSNRIPISTPTVFRNRSTLFTVGTVPHPYTMTILHQDVDELDLKFVRRKTKRDIWILAATKEWMGTGLSSYARLPRLKDAIAAEHSRAASLWLTDEGSSNTQDGEDWDWIFGFHLPREPMSKGTSETPVPGPERRPRVPKPGEGDGPVPSVNELGRERALLQSARRVVGDGSSRDAGVARIREIVESWSLADTEVWKFVRAYNARRQEERQMWERSEQPYLRKGLFDRWIDRVT